MPVNRRKVRMHYLLLFASVEATIEAKKQSPRTDMSANSALASHNLRLTIAVQNSMSTAIVPKKTNKKQLVFSG